MSKIQVKGGLEFLLWLSDNESNIHKDEGYISGLTQLAKDPALWWAAV